GDAARHAGAPEDAPRRGDLDRPAIRRVAVAVRVEQRAAVHIEAEDRVPRAADGDVSARRTARRRDRILDVDDAGPRGPDRRQRHGPARRKRLAGGAYGARAAGRSRRAEDVPEAYTP